MDIKYDALECYLLPIDEIYFDENFNCRDFITLDSLRELADGINNLGGFYRGLLEPVVVQPYTGLSWRLLCGHRRYRACKELLLWPSIPAMVRRDTTEREAKLINLNENLQRKSLNLLEEAKAIQKTFVYGETPKQISAELKISTRRVGACRRLLEMPEKIQAMAAAGQLTGENIYTIWKFRGEVAQIRAAEQLVGKRNNPQKTLRPALTKPRSRRLKGELNEKLEYMLSLGLSGPMPRTLAWAMGGIGDKEFNREIRDEIKRQRGE